LLMNFGLENCWWRHVWEKKALELFILDSEIVKSVGELLFSVNCWWSDEFWALLMFGFVKLALLILRICALLMPFLQNWIGKKLNALNEIRFVWLKYDLNLSVQ
jgi:hypothetical protein